MKSAVALLLGIAGGVLSNSTAIAQPYSKYQFFFTGTLYQTNANGNIATTPINEQTLLADRARGGGIADLSTVAIVYHINGDPKGDTVEIVSSTNGVTLTQEFGLWFGSDSSLGRYAVTNAAQTKEMRVEFIYTLNNSTYTASSSDSVGAAFITKDLSSVNNGVTNAVINGALSWEAVPHGTNSGSILAIGKFSVGKPLF